MRLFSLSQDSEPSRPKYTVWVSALKSSIRYPPCECVECQTGFYTAEVQCQPPFSYCRHLSDDTARGIISSYVKQTQESRARLTGWLTSHADALMQRWKKQSQGKRRILLNDVAPDLEEKPWVHFRYSYMDERNVFLSRNQTRRRQLLLPWLSVEALKTNPNMLFALLNYRTRFSPQDWAAFDCRQIDLSWARGWLDVDYSAICIVMYGPRYGDFVDWEAGAAHRGDILGFPRARLVVEAQAYLMETLCKIVEKILDGFIYTQTVRTKKWTELITTEGFTRTGEIEHWSVYTNQAFSAPPILDIGYLISLAKTRLDAMGDHLWDLQCDGAYMRRHIKSLVDTKTYKEVSNTLAGAFLFSSFDSEVFNYYWWRWIEIECRHVEDMHKKFGDSACTGQPLPVQYNRALGALESVLVDQIKYRTTALIEILPAAAGFSKYWSIECSADQCCADHPETCADLSRNVPHDTKKSLAEDPLDWCLMQILCEPDYEGSFDRAMLFAFLHDQLATATFKERARLDQVIYRRLSDISSCHEMLIRVRLHRPHNGQIMREELIESEDREVWKRLKKLKVRAGSRQPAVSSQAKINMGLALIENFYHKKSCDGPKDMKWVRQSQASRAALENFWATMRAVFKHEFEGCAFSLAERESLLEILSANLSPQYLEAVQWEKNIVSANVESAERLSSTLFVEDQAQSSLKAELAIALSRQKIKTRGEKPPTNEPLPPHIEGEAPGLDPEVKEATDTTTTTTTMTSSSSSSSIPVTKRAAEVFTLMFPSNEEEATFKSVNWDNFVHAMRDVGFTTRCNGG